MHKKVTDILTVSQALNTLDTDAAPFARGFRNGMYTMWVGSGISRSVAPDVRLLILKVITFVHARSQNGPDASLYSDALDEIFELAGLDGPTERSALEPEQAPEKWTNIERLLSALQNRYADVLDVRIPGTRDDLLLWDGSDFVETFMSEARPDAEHLWIALLLMEGVLTDVVSANWDNYIELAVEELSGGSWQELSPKVLPADLRTQPSSANLFKFHGCAAKAKEDPSRYRDYLVGRKEQITRWPHDPRNKTMLRELERLAVNRRTLVIGLSGQDTDIQAVFSIASTDQVWTWPEDPPAVVFAEQRLGSFQIDILKSAYRDGYTDNRDEILSNAHFASFGKPLLAALSIDVLVAKYSQALIVGLSGYLPPEDLEGLSHDIGFLRQKMAEFCRDGRKDHVRALLGSVAQLHRVVRHGRIEPNSKYSPFSTTTPEKVANDPTLKSGGNPELALALALLAKGTQSGNWSLNFSALRAYGTIGIENEIAMRSVAIVANSSSAIEAIKTGLLESDAANSVIICGTEPPLQRRRAPKASPGRSVSSWSRIIGLASLLEEAESADQLQALFRESIAL